MSGCGSDSSPASTGDRVASHGIVCRFVLELRVAQGPAAGGRNGGDRGRAELPTGPPRVSRPQRPRGGRPCAPGVRQLRAAGSACRIAVGAREHRGVRRRPEQRHAGGNSAGADSVGLHMVSTGSPASFIAPSSRAGRPRFAGRATRRVHAQGDDLANALGCADRATVASCMRMKTSNQICRRCLRPRRR